MLLGLTVKNKVCFVDGSLPCPTGDLKNSWIICNSVVTAWLLNSLSKEISASVNFTDSAREIWLDLQQRYQRKNRPRIFQLRKEISNLVQDKNSVTTYFAKLKSLWNELSSYRPFCSCGKCSCGGMKELAEYFQTEHVMAFLMGLNDSFRQVRTQLLLMEPEPTIQRAFALVVQEVEQCASASSDSSNAAALLVKNSSHNVVGRPSSNPPKKKERPLCTHCNILGHTVDRCYKIHGYPPEYRNQKTKSDAVDSSAQTSADSLSSLSAE